MDQSWCVGLQSLRRGDLGIAGGKAANLGELLFAGFDVPPGFVVTTSAYRAAVGVAASRNAVEARGVPEDVAQGIRQAYAELSGAPVAVRSSATAEDLPGATFAGQQETFLDVVGAEDVVAAVRGCWVSLFSERAVAYRGRLSIDPASVAMAVVVQKMVPADTAGVMFTADPVTGARDRVVINASPGVGEAVVSGDVTPDHVVVATDGRIIERRLLQQVSMDDAQLGDLAATGRRIAAHFGRPQDIEWAVSRGRLFILQTRPMTALPPAPVPLTRFQRAYGPVLLELLPRRPLPMELTAFIRPIVGQHILDMAAELAGIRVDFAAIFPQEDGILQELRPPRLRPTVRTPARLLRTVLRGLRELRGSPHQWRHDPLLSAYRDGVAELDRMEMRALSWDELTAIPGRAQTLVDLMTRLRVDHLPSAVLAVAKLTVVQFLTRRKVDLRDALSSAPTMTRAANDELAALADAARGVPELCALVVAGDLDQVEITALSVPAVAHWWRRFQMFLTTFGHRETTSILLVHDPSWAASPGTVCALIRVLMEATTTQDSPPASASSTSRTGLAAWQQSLGRRAAEGLALREDSHFELSRIMPSVRAAVMEMGRRLVESGDLDETEDVWMLTLDEVSAWTPGDESGTEGLRGTAHRRAAAHAELSSTPLIATATLYPHRRGSAAAIVVGTGSSGGRASGRVRIISGADEFGTLRAGEVLVCSATNPSWTPLFQRAAAVVVDHGGVASHAAIVAREYGIPAVMGAANATTVLHDGQLVTVNGDLGEVVPKES